jgi:hypothetical protein
VSFSFLGDFIRPFLFLLAMEGQADAWAAGRKKRPAGKSLKSGNVKKTAVARPADPDPVALSAPEESPREPAVALGATSAVANFRRQLDVAMSPETASPEALATSAAALAAAAAASVAAWSPGDTTVAMSPGTPSKPAESSEDAAVAMPAAMELDDFVAQQMREEESQLNSREQPQSPEDAARTKNRQDANSPDISSQESSVSRKRKATSALQESNVHDDDVESEATSGLEMGDGVPAVAEVTDSNQSSGTASSAARSPVAREENNAASRSSSSGDAEKDADVWAYAKGAGLQDDNSDSSESANNNDNNASARTGPVVTKSAARHRQITDSYQRPPKKPKPQRGRKKKTREDKKVQGGKPKKISNSADELANAAECLLLKKHLEPQQFKDERLKVGSRVYAVYPGLKPEKESEYTYCPALILTLMVCWD